MPFSRDWFYWRPTTADDALLQVEPGSVMAEPNMVVQSNDREVFVFEWDHGRGGVYDSTRNVWAAVNRTTGDHLRILFRPPEQQLPDFGGVSRKLLEVETQLRASRCRDAARNRATDVVESATMLVAILRPAPRKRSAQRKGEAEMNMTNSLMAAAVTGILAGAACGGQASPAPAAPAAEAPAAPVASSEPVNDRIPADNDSGMASKHDCKGKNDCKGRGGCKTELNTCRGKNECKGRGGCKS